MTVNKFEFTAFAEADLLQGVNGSSLGCGDKFTMPATASLCFEVKDDDHKLSGDACRNENADDRSYQTAKILDENGDDIGNGRQIYAEQSLWLKDEKGNTYRLIELEQEGTNDDYYAFDTSYGLPPVGAKLHVVSTSNVKWHNQPKYSKLTAGDKPEEPSHEQICIEIEAEHFHKSGFKTVHGDHASGGELVKLKHAGGHGDLWTKFEGPTGEYDITVCVQDECDGKSEIMVKVDGKVVGVIKLDKNTDGRGSDDGKFSEFTLKDVDIKEGSKVSLWVDGDRGEFVRIDKVKFECEKPKFRECDDPDAVKIDFEGAVAGDVIDTQFDDVTISAVRHGSTGRNDAMIFDSANPTGGDTDLATADQGNLLIISEDNDSSDPDDNAGGGTISFTFDNPSFLYDIKVVDTEESGVITLFDNDGAEIASFTIPSIGDGETAQVLLDTADVKRMEIKLNGSGAVDDLCYVPGEPPNQKPVAVDDKAAVCADEETTFSLLANDSDPDGDAISVTEIKDADETVGVGGTITLDSGATVTLNADGTVTYDGTTAYADLLIGQEALDEFQYTLADSDGAAVMGDVDVKVCGALNTIETIEASLPSTINFQVIDENEPNGSSTEAFTVKLSGSGDSRLDGLVIEEAYCLAVLADLDAGGFGDNIDLAPLLTADLYLAHEDAIPSDALDEALDPNAAADLDLINWIINQDFGSIDNGDGTNTTYTDGEIQGAIWGLTENIAFVAEGGGSTENAQEILDLAIANGEGFKAGEGDLVGLFLDPTAATEAAGHKQPFIIAVRFEDLEEECVCEPDALMA